MRPNDVHDSLRAHVLVDGYDMVLDTAASQGSWLVDARTGDRYLDVFTFYASSPLGMNHPDLLEDEDFRATLLVDHVSEGFYSGDHYIHHYLGRGITDRLFVVMPVNEDVESYFMFDRLRGQPDFTPQDLEIASYALRSLGWLNRQIHLSYGQLMADAPLTPTERGVLKHMLAGSAEKNIAEAMGQSPHTTHQYVKTLFRKFNVRSRAELTALWLGHS